MPVPSLSIEFPDEGLPRQPIPLRFAHLVTGLPVSEFLFLLAKRQEGRYEYLTGYEYVAGAEPREVRAAVYAEILEATTNEESAQELLKRLPSNHFVWSDELAAAFSQFIFDHPGMETAQAQGMGLSWNPALLGLDALVEECPDLSPLISGATPVTELSQRELRKRETTALHERWQTAYDELKEQHPLKPDSWIAEKISRQPVAAGRSSETIRRNLKRK